MIKETINKFPDNKKLKVSDSSNFLGRVSGLTPEQIETGSFSKKDFSSLQLIDIMKSEGLEIKEELVKNRLQFDILKNHISRASTDRKEIM